MIRFAVIHRAKDGLALSASTDMDSGIELRECKRYAKLISRKARQFPVRSTMLVGKFRIFFTCESDCCFLLISEANFQAVLAFNFLDELKKDFLGKFSRSAINKAVRPYSFIEFDSFIQKTKQRYNSTRTLYTRVSLNEITEELQNNPPYEVHEQDLGGNAISQTYFNHTPSLKTTTTRNNKLSPLSVVGKVSLVLSSLCVLLNIIRFIPFMSHHSVDIEEESHWLVISLSFFFSAFFSMFQCYMLTHVIRFRPIANVLVALLSAFLLYYLHDLRNSLQITFHLFSNCFIAYNIWNRPAAEKLPNYNV